MKIATWSVNSVNCRLGYLRHWLEKRQPHLVALQKLRISRKHHKKSPKQSIEDAGYHVKEHLADDQWGSVAILIRRDWIRDGSGPKVWQTGLPGRETEGRLLTVDVGELRISSVYAPAAPHGDKNKDQIRRSIKSKVEWLDDLAKHVADQCDGSKPTFLCGDFNVVLDGEAQPKTLYRSNEERDALRSLCGERLVDLYRDFHSDGEPGFNSGTPIRSRGVATKPNTRLHLILGSKSVAAHVTSACVDLKYRGPLEDLPGHNWAPCAPVIIEVNDDLM